MKGQKDKKTQRREEKNTNKKVKRHEDKKEIDSLLQCFLHCPTCANFLDSSHLKMFLELLSNVVCLAVTLVG